MLLCASGLAPTLAPRVVFQKRLGVATSRQLLGGQLPTQNKNAPMKKGGGLLIPRSGLSIAGAVGRV